MASTSDFKNGLIFERKNHLWKIVEFQHVKPGKGPAFVRTKIKNIKTQKTYNVEVEDGKGEGVIDLMEVFENSLFSLSLDNLLEPSKKIYKYNLQFKGEII